MNRRTSLRWLTVEALYALRSQRIVGVGETD
jgi:hypothetical protein